MATEIAYICLMKKHSKKQIALANKFGRMAFNEIGNAKKTVRIISKIPNPQLRLEALNGACAESRAGSLEDEAFVFYHWRKLKLEQNGNNPEEFELLANEAAASMGFGMISLKEFNQVAKGEYIKQMPEGMRKYLGNLFEKSKAKRAKLESDRLERRNARKRLAALAAKLIPHVEPTYGIKA